MLLKVLATFALIISIHAKAAADEIVTTDYPLDDSEALSVVTSKKTGEIFTQNSHNPLMGEAYRDPSGTVWGGPYLESNATTASSASLICESMNARLPTTKEVIQLAKYLGFGFNALENGRSLVDITTTDDKEVLPKLSEAHFWTTPTMSPSGVASKVNCAKLSNGGEIKKNEAGVSVGVHTGLALNTCATAVIRCVAK